MEASLKLKEISYIHSEAYAAGELKHGTISLIDKGTPVISIVTDEDIKLKTLSNIKEVCARGALSVIITNQEIEDKDLYKELIKIDNVSDLISSALVIVKCQLIAYYVAKLNGCDIDKPRNLAKSVTVE
jgi:glucosamine--fructose-6-phosphate aminotransferase (isomerizing)